MSQVQELVYNKHLLLRRGTCAHKHIFLSNYNHKLNANCHIIKIFHILYNKKKKITKKLKFNCRLVRDNRPSKYQLQTEKKIFINIRR